MTVSYHDPHKKEVAERAAFISSLRVGDKVYLGSPGYERSPLIGTVIRFTAKQIVMKCFAQEIRARLEDGQILGDRRGMRSYVAPVTDKHIEAQKTLQLNRWLADVARKKNSIAQLEAMKAAYESVPE